MSDKAKYVLFSILDFALTFGGSAAVIVYNYITPDNSLGYKLSFSGIVLVVFIVLTAKAIFEKNYRRKYDTLLQQLAEATTTEDKESISEAINRHKTANDIYNRITLLLPFAILFVVTYLGSVALSSLHSTVGLILTSMGAGSVFNVIKKPVGDKVQYAKLTKRRKNK